MDIPICQHVSATQELRLRRYRVRRCVILFSGICNSLYAFYGEDTGVRIARKHLGWYCEQLLTDPVNIAPQSDGSFDVLRAVCACRTTAWRTGWQRPRGWPERPDLIVLWGPYMTAKKKSRSQGGFQCPVERQRTCLCAIMLNGH